MNSAAKTIYYHVEMKLRNFVIQIFRIILYK